MRPVLAATVLGLVSCVGEAPLEAEVGSPNRSLNQFRKNVEALTLSDGGLCPITVNADAELMVRALPVVEDPLRTTWTGGLANPSDGAWTFGRLMTEMAGANDPEIFVRGWLSQWDAPRVVNGFTVPPRNMNGLVTQPWLAASGGARLDLRRAPFRLLAIVNRMDLRDLSRGSAGEGRFVFGVLDQNGNQTQFTVIFEYNLPATTEADVERWAADWHALGALPIGSPQYLTALEAITRRFSTRGAAPTRPNGSAINQVRTNEIALAAPWELREFTLNAGGQLVQAPVAQTVDLSFNNSPALAQFINANAASILTATHVVPAQFNGQPFLAGSALTNPGHFFNAPGIANPEARFQFSINTCNGCHAGETQTPFLHVFPRQPGQIAQLSGFLTGTTVRDPVSGQNRTLNDLAVRSESLLAVLCKEPGTGPTPPTVRIKAPVANATVRGATTLEVEVTGQLDAVQYRLDDAPLGPPVPPPFSFLWNADTATPGTHTLTAVGLAMTGSVTSPPVSIVVAPSFGPDFTVSILSAPTLLDLGAELVVTAQVCNRGNAAGFSEIEVLLSNDGVPSLPPDMPVGMVPFSLSPNECRTIEVRGRASPPPPDVAPPPGVVGQRLQLLAVVDRLARQPELVEDNNLATRAITLGRGSDFTVTIRPPAAVLPGASFVTSATLCNAGNAPGSVELELIASSDTTISTPPDFFVGNHGRLTVPAGQCQAVSIATGALPPLATTFLAARAVRGDPELSLSNNVSPAVRINVGALADFAVSSVSAPAAVLPGAAFTGSFTVCNQGTIEAAPVVTIVRAPARTFSFPSPEVVPVATVPVPSLVPGQCRAHAFTALAPTAPGAFFAAAIVDATQVVPEFSETNNQLAASAVTSVGALPDFTFTSISVTGNAVTPGGAFTATVSICNRGTITGSTVVELRLGGQPVGATSTSLAANQCRSLPIAAVAAVTSPGPTFSLLAVADPVNTVPEFTETNNTSPATELVVGLGPDFAISSIVAPTAIAPFTPFTATITACNRGTQPGSASVDLFVSADSAITLSDHLVGGLPFTLAPGECRSQQLTASMNAPLMLPPPPALGVTAFLGAIADPFNALPELRETNNAGGARSFVFGRGPDFVVSSLTAPTSVLAGTSFSVTPTVCNRGTERGVARLTLLFSTDTTLPTGHPIAPNVTFADDGGDQLFDLAAGACVSRALPARANAPLGLRGPMFFGAVIDLDRVQPELSDANNSFVRSITVQ